LARPVSSDKKRESNSQRYIPQVAHLQELPDHCGFKHRTDATRRDNERIREQYEVMQPREEYLPYSGCGGVAQTTAPVYCANV
jgi:hypothetical protein